MNEDDRSVRAALEEDLASAERALGDATGGMLAAEPSAATVTGWVRAVVECAARAPEYNVLPSEVVDALRAVRTELGEATEARCVRRLVLAAMRRWVDADPAAHEPSSSWVGRTRLGEARRLLDDLRDDGGKGRRWTLADDALIKDLQSYTGRLVPCGAQIVDVHAAVPRRLLVSDGTARLTGNLRFFARAGGFARFYAIHTHTPTLDEFHADGWDRCYLCIAELLRADPSARGMVGGSWFYDPALERVSPRLAYLRRRPLDEGARLFRVGPTESAHRDALATSATRRSMHERGEYVPTQYCLVWPRAGLLAWAERDGRSVPETGRRA